MGALIGFLKGSYNHSLRSLGLSVAFGAGYPAQRPMQNAPVSNLLTDPLALASCEQMSRCNR